MNYKKTTLLFLTLFLVLATVTAISAATDDTTATTDNTQTATTVDSASSSTSSNSDSGHMSTSSDSSSVSTTTSTAKSVDTTQSTSTSPTKTSQDTSSDKVSTDTSSSTKTSQDTTTSQSTKVSSDSSQSQDTGNANDNSNEVNSVKNSTVDSSKIISTAQTHHITNDNISAIFDFENQSGPLNELVNDGDTIDIHGTIELHNQSLTINKAVNIISSTNDAYIYLDTVAGSYFGEDPGSSFIINKDGSYTNVTGIGFYNTQIWVYNASYVTLDNITVYVMDQQIGSGNGHTSIREGSQYVTVKNSNFYTENNGGSSSVVLAGANYCTIDNNNITGTGNIGNLIYITTYNVGTDTSELNRYNNITNNYVTKTDSALGICWGIVVDGYNNLVENNTVDYAGGTGFTVQTGGSSTTGNITINNNDFSNTTVIQAYANMTFTNNILSRTQSNAANCIFINNTFVSADSVLSSENFTIINNTFEYGVTIGGSDATVSGNTFMDTVTLSGEYQNVTDNTFESTAVLSGNYMNASENVYDKNVTISGSYKNITENTFNEHVLMSGSYVNFTDNYVYSDTDYSINVTGSNNNITDNYLLSTMDAGDDSVVVTDSSNLVENNRPLTVEITLEDTTLIYNEDNTLTFILTNKNGENIADVGTANVTIDDYTTTIDIVNGVGYLTYLPTSIGDYELIFSYCSNGTTYQNKTVTIPITVISNPDRTYYVTNYEELVEAVNTINSIAVDNDYHIELQDNNDPNAYDVTETITWGTGAVKNLTIAANGQTINGNNEKQFMIVSDGYNLRLEEINIEDCTATNGGAIYNNGILTLIDSTITNSVATSGGAIYNSHGEITITNSTFSDNSAEDGAVIYNYMGNLSVTDSNFKDNTATNNGSAIYLEMTATDTDTTATITGNMFENNSSPNQDMIYTNQAITIADNTFTLPEQLINEGQTAKTVSPILDTSLPSTEKVTFIISQEGTIVDTIEVTKNSDNIVELDYTYTTLGGNDISITYESSYTNNINELIYVQSLDSTIYVTCYEELVEAVALINSQSSNQNYTIILQDNDDPEAYYLTETLSWGTGVVTNLTIDGNSQTINGQESQFIEVVQGYYLELANITITNCTSTNGAVYGKEATLYITDSSFIDNTATSNGGAIYSDTSNTTVINSVFINNTASTSGGALYKTNTGSLTLTNITFINNTATNYGGAVYTSGGYVTITGTTFINSTVTRYGGGAMYLSGNTTIDNSSFINNAGSSEGAIYLSGNGNISNSYFENNSATTSGGAIYYSGEVNIVNTTFIDNSATSGGAIYKFGGTTNIVNSTFTQNTATSGGAIYTNGGESIISQSNFTENTATSGGALYLRVNNTITNSNFTENTATNGGAIYVYDSGNMTMSDSNIVNNTASTGSAIYFGYNTAYSTYRDLENNNITSSVIGYVDEEVTITSPIYYQKLSRDPEDVTITIEGYYSQTETVNTPEVSIKYTFTDMGDVPVIFDYPSLENNNICVMALIDGITYISVESTTGSVGDEITLVARINIDKEKATDGYVVFKVNGKTLKDEDGNTIETPVIDGVAECTYTIPYTVSNTYEITAVYYSDEYGVIRTTTNATITITEKTANIEILTDTLLKAGQTVTLKALITDENGTIVTSGKVVFKLNGVSLRDADDNVLYAYVDEDGYATLIYTIPDNYSAKDYLLTAVFQANGFERSETNTTVTLTKIDTKIVIDESLLTLSVNSDDTISRNSATSDVTTYDDASDVTTYDDASDGTITINQGENLQLKATIIDQGTGEAVTGTTKVAVKFNEKTVIQEYVTDGVIDLTLYTSTFKNPTYTITVIAGENSQYNESSFNGTLVVATKD